MNKSKTGAKPNIKDTVIGTEQTITSGANTRPTEPSADLKTPFTMEKQSGADPTIDPVPDNIVNIGAKRRKKGADQSGADKHTQTGADLSVTGSNQVRKQGQRGKDKQVRKKRTDSNQLAFSADDRARILHHNLNVMKLGKIHDRNNVEEVRERISFYIDSCIEHQVLPTVAGLALCLGIDRTTLWSWMNNKQGEIRCQEVIDTLKSVYTQINCQYEDLLTQGKITPVAGFFLMQNNFGYKNQTDHVVVAAGDPEPDTSDIAARAGLLEEGER